ncbi:MAG: hypothetical protein AB7L66_21045 [Gemmatimonadales bacterium]
MRALAAVGPIAGFTALLASCLTEPVCGCSEPGSTMVVYGTVSQAGSLAAAPGVDVSFTVSQVVSVVRNGVTVETCPMTADRVEVQGPVRTDASGRYRMGVLSVARLRQCIWASAGTAAAFGSAFGIATFQPPGGTDSVRVDLTLPPH